ncbi:ComEC/Rec2 family competence protein [Brevundimonas sp. NPDC046655]|uniref:ComEC/Rec2 family competence protein n=1 Tax=unclassified Brevundimonas TaxID=2622653 RepID=UPI00384F5417
MSDVLLLDVGHGNCTIVQGSGSVAVIDAPIGSALLDTLDELGVTHVEHALISHADADHIQGILALLTSRRFSVGALYLNPDRDRTTTAWRDLVHAVSVAERTGAFKPYTALNTATPGVLQVGDITLTVASPSAALALSAVKGVAPQGGVNTSNTLSAVIKVERTPDMGVLLAGDLDGVGLVDVQASGANVRASALVYPHHGGLSGSAKASTFGQALLRLVGPAQVYVSNGRNKHSNPRPEVVSTILDHGCGLACTQLAKSCGDPASADHLEKWPAAGREHLHSCAGTISLRLEPTGAVRDAEREGEFRIFVGAKVSSPMCRRSRH